MGLVYTKRNARRSRNSAPARDLSPANNPYYKHSLPSPLTHRFHPSLPSIASIHRFHPSLAPHHPGPACRPASLPTYLHVPPTIPTPHAPRALPLHMDRRTTSSCLPAPLLRRGTHEMPPTTTLHPQQPLVESATATATAAKHRLDNLHRQLTTYRARLSATDAQLRALQRERALARTVVEVTLPGEIGRAERDLGAALYVFFLRLLSFFSSSCYVLCDM